MFPGSADRHERAGRREWIQELPPDARRDMREHALTELELLVRLDEDHEPAAQHEVDLRLPGMPVNAASLARLQRDLVEAELADSEGSPEQ